MMINEKEHKTGCLICGEDLRNFDISRFSECYYCGETNEVTPVPIPNTEVKLFSADGTCTGSCVREQDSAGYFF